MTRRTLLGLVPSVLAASVVDLPQPVQSKCRVQPEAIQGFLDRAALEYEFRCEFEDYAGNSVVDMTGFDPVDLSGNGIRIPSGVTLANGRFTINDPTFGPAEGIAVEPGAGVIDCVVRYGVHPDPDWSAFHFEPEPELTPSGLKYRALEGSGAFYRPSAAVRDSIRGGDGFVA